MAQSPVETKQDWTHAETRPKDVRINADACPRFPSPKCNDFGAWIYKMQIVLAENNLQHHINMDDSAAPPGLTQQEIANMTHGDGTPFPCADEAGPKAKHNLQTSQSRAMNRTKVFAFIVSRCQEGEDAGYYALDQTYFNKPNNLLKAIEARYDIADPNLAEVIEDKFDRFVMEQGEGITETKTRLDTLVRQLTLHKVKKTDKEIRKIFLKSLKNREWDEPVRKEKLDHPIGGARTYQHSFIAMRADEEYRKTRNGGRVAPTTPANVYSLNIKTDPATGKVMTGLSDKANRKLFLALTAQYSGQPPAQPPAHPPTTPAGNPTTPSAVQLAWKKRVQFKNKTISRPKFGCFKCGDMNHRANTCPQGQLPPNARGTAEGAKYAKYKLACDAANEVYHFNVDIPIEANATKVTKAPKGRWRPRQRTNPTTSKESEKEEMLEEEDHDQRIVVDSGANVGCETKKNKLTQYEKVNLTATTASGNDLRIGGKGRKKYAKDTPAITDVMHCPEIRKNLMSVSQTCEQWKASAIFNSDGLVYYTGELNLNPSNVIATGYQEKGLYYLDNPANTRPPTKTGGEKDVQAMSISLNYVKVGVYNFETGTGEYHEPLTKREVAENPIPRPKDPKRKVERWNPMRLQETDLHLWHERFGHKFGLRRTIRYQGCLGLPKSYRDLTKSKNICEACLQAKMSQCIHPPVFRRQWQLGQLLHFDVHAKPTQSWNGKKYTLMTVEHVSKMPLPFFTATKDQVGDHCIYTIVWYERRTGNKCLSIQCDGGGEFVGTSTPLYQYCMKNGIHLQKTSRESPQENGVAEAYNKVMHYTAEALKYASGMAEKYWPERETFACLIDSYIVKPTQMITSHEMIHGFRPNVELIKVFGCHGFAYIPRGARKNKQSPRMRPGIYMGVSPMMNGYKLYDPVSMKFFECSTAVFDERSFGFTALITRVSGAPQTIPSEWVEQLNKEWKAMYKGTSLDDEFEAGYADPKDYRKEDFFEDQPDEYENIEQVDPRSPVTKSRLEEISFGNPNDNDKPKLPDMPIQEEAPQQAPASIPETEVQEISTKDIPRPSTPPLRIARPSTPPLIIPIGMTSSSLSSSCSKAIEPTPPIRQSQRLRDPANQKYYGPQALNCEIIQQVQEDTMYRLPDCKHDEDIINHHFFMSNVVEDAMMKLAPKSFKQATSGRQTKEWMESMSREIEAHKVNNTFELVPRPKQNDFGKIHVIVKSLWKYRVKTQQNVITNNKSRICADGRRIVSLLKDVFAGTPMSEIVFLVFALAAHYAVVVIAGDVPAAYVQAAMPDGDTLYYVTQPQGFEDPSHPSWVWLLKKCLYGLPLSGHQWCEELATFLISIGMTRIKADPSAFFIQDTTGFLLLVVTVDDTIDVATSEKLRARIHNALIKRYRWKHCGVCEWHLGMRVTQGPDKITIDQTAYLKTMLERFESLEIKNSDVPMNLLLTAPPPDAIPSDFPYQSVVGCLIWMTKTRFDISFSVSHAARFMKNHQPEHDRAVLKILGYLRKNPDWGVGFEVNRDDEQGPIRIGFSSDSSWADIVPTRESSFGYATFINRHAIQMKSKITPNVCAQVHEAEYHSFAQACQQSKFITSFMDEIGLAYIKPVTIDLDSESAQNTLESWKVTQRNKQIDVRCHIGRELVNSGRVKPVKVPSAENSVDIATKPLPKAPFEKHRASLLMHLG